MDKRDFTVIENEVKIDEKQKNVSRHTNPIAKKFVKFHDEKKFNVRDLYTSSH